jgi:hypothetical protein
MRLSENDVFDLRKNYDFRVSVSGQNGFFSAELKLSPENITIRISGDQQVDRDWGYVEWELESLDCSGHEWNFRLFDLHCISSGHYNLEQWPGMVQHFEAVYVASYAVISRCSIQEIDLRGIQLFSPSLEQWVGLTEKQEDIVRDQMIGNRVGLQSGFEGFNTREFTSIVEGQGEVYLNYNIKATASPLEFAVGVKFPPSFCFYSTRQILPKDVMRLYQKTYSFLSLLQGREILMDRVVLSDDNAHSRDAYLYYSKPSLASYEVASYSFFPLSHGLRFDSLGLPPFPLDALSNYFSESYMFAEKWEKYVKYRRMSNVEERFLGYFRLLESLTKKSKTFLDSDLLKLQVARVENIMVKIFGSSKDVKGFLRGIDRYNNSKYNTAKCILDFYNRLPDGVRKSWSLKQDAINSICKLRNDISHANDYFEKEDDLLAKCIFIESLLMVALLETVGIPVAVTAKLLHRLPGSHHLFQKN